MEEKDLSPKGLGMLTSFVNAITVKVCSTQYNVICMSKWSIFSLKKRLFIEFNMRLKLYRRRLQTMVKSRNCSFSLSLFDIAAYSVWANEENHRAPIPWGNLQCVS